MISDLDERVARLNQWSDGLCVRFPLRKAKLRKVESARSDYEPAKECGNDDRSPSGSRRK